MVNFTSDAHDAGSCSCAVCNLVRLGLSEEEALARILDEQRVLVTEHGWCCHAVPRSDGAPQQNVHTHGLPESFEHLDFQIVAFISPEQAWAILNELVEQVRSGRRFESGIDVEDILERWPVRLISAVESGRTVLRVILPDCHGNLDEENMDEWGRDQYQHTGL